MIRPYFDRRHAGEVLARKLQAYKDQPQTIVIALPRGGVPVGYEVARALHAPMDICLTCKLGVPGHEELAMGALAADGVRVLNEEVVHALRITTDQIQTAESRGLAALERQKIRYRSESPLTSLCNQTVIIVDDGLGTGASMRAAIATLKKHSIRKLLAAVPVGAPEICRFIENEVDELICATRPANLHSVGSWYEDYSPTTDEQIRRLLDRATENWLLQDSRSGCM